MRLRDLRLLRDDAHDEDAIMAFAREHGLSVYDAAYLETALRRGDTLATLDRDLARAEVAEGVALDSLKPRRLTEAPRRCKRTGVIVVSDEISGRMPFDKAFRVA